MTYQQGRVGINTALAALICLIATKFGIDVPNGVALAAVGIVAAVSAYFSPGWADRTGLKAYPAGLSAAVVIVLGWALPLLANVTGIDALNNFTQADLVALAGLVPFVVGIFTPAAESDIDPELDRDRVGL